MARILGQLPTSTASGGRVLGSINPQVNPLDGFAQIDQQLQKKKENPLTTQIGFGGAVKQDVSKRQEDVNKSIKAYQTGEQGLGSTVFQSFGSGAGLLGDIVMRGISSLAPDFIEKPVVKGVEKGIGAVASTEPGQTVIQGISSWAEQNPEAARNLEAVINIASLYPGGKAVELAPKAGEIISQTALKSGELLSKSANALKSALIKPQNIDEIVGRITQGTKEEIVKATEALKLVDTTGIKKFSELKDATNETISSLARKQDELLDLDKRIHRLDSLNKVFTSGDQSITQNYVKDAIGQLKEYYSKVNDPQGLADINALEKKALSEGLTTKEINQLARDYGSELASKGFTKTGEQITSVNKVAAENTRRGLKNTARELLPDNASKELDSSMSNLYTLESTASKMEDAVQKLENKIKKRGLIERVGRAIGKGVDVATGGGLRGFMTSFIPSNVGNKTLSALDLEMELAKNLKRVNKLVESGSDSEILNFIQEIKSKVIERDGFINFGAEIGDQAVNLKLHPEDAKIMKQYIEAMRNKTDLSKTLNNAVEDLRVAYGIKDVSADKLAQEFDDILFKSEEALKKAKAGVGTKIKVND